MKNVSLINAKNNNTLYGTIISKHQVKTIVSTNRSNIFTVILNNVFEIPSLKNKHLKHIVGSKDILDSNKNK